MSPLCCGSSVIDSKALDLTSADNQKAKILLDMCAVHKSLKPLFSSVNENNRLNANAMNRLNEIFYQQFVATAENKVDLQIEPHQVKIELIKDSFSKEDVLAILELTHQKILRIAAKQFGASVILDAFHISKSKIKEHKLTPDVAKTLSAQFDSVRYALYKLDEKGAEEWIYRKSNISIFQSNGLVGTLIKDFNYRVVENPKENDLIVYLEDSGQELHVGVMSKEGKVESKWGSIPQIFYHPIHMNPYSNNFTFLSKTKTPLAEKGVTTLQTVSLKEVPATSDAQIETKTCENIENKNPNANTKKNPGINGRLMKSLNRIGSTQNVSEAVMNMLKKSKASSDMF